MSTGRRRTVIVIALAAIAGVAAGIAVGLSEDDEPAAPASEPAATPAPAPDEPSEEKRDEPPVPPLEEDPRGEEPGPSGPAPETADEEGAASAARGYIQAIDRRAGGAVCRGFAPGALGGIKFPKRRSSCAATVEASLGFARPGLPEWERSEMTDAVSAHVDGDTARVVATVFTVYADVREPTIEDDIVYLERQGDRWLVAKPSLTLHRAIGDPDPPPSALTPP